jgi:hypothetical protein
MHVSSFFGCEIVSDKLHREKNRLDKEKDVLDPKSGTRNDKAVNYLYAMKTGTSNLRSHLKIKHEDDYRSAVNAHGWTYATTMTLATSAPNPRKLRDLDIPDFSFEEFLKALVRFIVADDQVSPNRIAFHLPLSHLQSIRVVECPEFRYLCLLLRESLVDADIPRRDKMREAILKHWRKSYEELKVELSVSLRCFLPSFPTN